VPFFRTDHWRSAIVHADVGSVIAAGSFDGLAVTLLPDIGDHRFLADPFGLVRDGLLHVFVEAYDYRICRGTIEVLIYQPDGTLLDRREVLRTAWHLSYPFVFEHDGAIFMLPEAAATGTLTLYRATAFPFQWEPVMDFTFPHAAIDATPLFFAGKWWLFWTPVGTKAARQSTLCLSVADGLTAPWQHLGEVWTDRAGARPGGTPVVMDDHILLPVQDCRGTYGRAVRWLRIVGLETGRPIISAGSFVEKPQSLAARFPDGMHTLSAAGPYTLLDVKRVGYGPKREFMKLRRRLSGR